MNVSTQVSKNGHNSTCDQYFSLKLAPLFSVYTEISIHAKSTKFMKIPTSPISWSQV